MTSNYSNTTWASFMRGLMALMMAMLTASTAMAMSENVTMQVGETKTLNLPSSFTSMYPYCKSTTWMSLGNEYVTVTSSSMFSATIKAKKAYSTPIVVRCDYYYYALRGGTYVYGGHTYYDFIVTVEGLQPTAIRLDPPEATLDRGKSVNLKPVLTPENATTTFSWSTSSEGVATVDMNGHVIGQNYGEATITCKTANGLEATCSVKVQRPTPTKVSIDDLLTLTIGESATLTPTLKPSNASTTYSWSSDNSQVASVNSSGEVTARKKGLARITVTTANGLSDYCDVTVYAPSPSSVSIKKSITLEVGQSETLTPTLSPSNAETSYTWSSSDSDIASVSSNGTVKGNAPGTANVTVKTANGKTASCQVTVNEVVAQPTNVSIDESISLVIGQSQTLTPTLTPSNATTTYAWVSSNISVATVNSSGKVTAIKKGTARITVTTANGLSDYCNVTVSAPSPTSVSINSSLTLEVGQSETITPTLSPSNAETSYTWTSSNSSIVSVSSNGTVKAIAPGTAKVTVKTDNGKTASCQVTVNEQEILPTSITMTDCLDLTVGDEYRLTPTISPANATNTTVSWSSSNMAVATVKNGLVKAEGEGTCYISATTSNGLTAKCYVVVSQRNTDDNGTDITEGWEGNYQFTADVTRFVASEMPFNEVFDMTITQKEDDYYITSMMGCNTVFIIYEGLKLNIIDTSHAEIVLRYNNCLGNPINGGRYSNFHELNPDDEFNYINNQVITITRHADGTTEMSDFNIYAFGSETDYEYLREAKYRGVIGSKMDAANIKNVLRENDSLEVFDLNGRCIYRGQKVECPRLDKGMYIFMSGEVTRKVFVR